MTENYEELRRAAVRISGNSPLAEELLHYTLDEFLLKPTVNDIIGSGGGRFYCVRIMMNSWKSTTSPFFHTYRQTALQLDGLSDLVDIPDEDEEPTQEKAKRAREVLNFLPWYDKMLFETFVEENHTVSSLARATGIPRTSVSLTINRVRRFLKENI
jgi:DNA-directed RNA polymerase specialized sigma24 family protein